MPCSRRFPRRAGPRSDRRDVRPAAGVRERRAARRALPRPPVRAAAGKDRDAYLQGGRGRRRAVRGRITPEIRERIDTELDVIISMGFSGYFLIVWDLIRFARENEIRVGPGRGSAAGPSCRTRCGSPTWTRSSTGLRAAVPEPRTRPDARHRHGLRRASAGRGHPPRGGQSTGRTASPRSSRSRRSREAGDPRRGPRAGVPSVGRRPTLQDARPR